jgi:hypothetical protein
MKCEKCNQEHNGEYASGRFCSNKCAKSFSTKEKRSEINKKVSKTIINKSLKGIPLTEKQKIAYKNKIGSKMPKYSIEKMRNSLIEYNKERIKNIPIEKLGIVLRRRILFNESNHQCTICETKNVFRKDGKCILEIDHINGDHMDNTRENLRVVYPTCHALYSERWRNCGNKGNKKVSKRIRSENIAFKPIKEERERKILATLKEKYEPENIAL